MSGPGYGIYFALALLMTVTVVTVLMAKVWLYGPV